MELEGKRWYTNDNTIDTNGGEFVLKKQFQWLFLTVWMAIIVGGGLCPTVSYAANTLKNVKQVVLVTVPDRSSSEATVIAYQRTAEGRWNTVQSSSGRVGKYGIEPIETRKQGTYKTPQGVMMLTGAYGRLADPGALFSYQEIQENMYWDLNSGSKEYNQLVYSNPGGDYEHLIDYATYDYMLTTDYNREQTAGKGGAIFFHCNGSGATSGCISVPKDVMRWYIRWLDPDKKPAIIVTTSDAVQKYLVPTTKIQKVSAMSDTSLKISWKRVYGTSKYTIQRKTEGGSYRTVKTITDPSVTSWTDTNLRKGKTYYYRIKTRCYIDGISRYAKASASEHNKLYFIKYNANGGSGSMAQTIVPFGERKSLRANQFTRKGYTFRGWNAYRVSDGRYYTKNHGWKKESTIKKKGYTKKLFSNRTSVSGLTLKNQDIITMKAIWKKRS